MAMIRSESIRTATVALCVALGPLSAFGQDEAARTEEARKLAVSLMGPVSGKRQEVIKSGGPAAAVGVCTSLEPTTTGELLRQHGVRLTRVSLKVCNALLGSPDALEQGVLNELEARLARGEAAEKI